MGRCNEVRSGCLPDISCPRLRLSQRDRFYRLEALLTHSSSSPATDRPLTPEERRLALADWLEQAPTDLIAFGTGAKDVVRPDYLLADDVAWIIEQCHASAKPAAPQPSSAGMEDALAKTIWLAGFKRAFDREPADPWENQADSTKAAYLDTARAVIKAGFVTGDPAQPKPEPTSLQAVREDERLACWKIAEEERHSAAVDKAAWLVAFDIANKIKMRGYPLPSTEGK